MTTVPSFDSFPSPPRSPDRQPSNLSKSKSAPSFDSFLEEEEKTHETKRSSANHDLQRRKKNRYLPPSIDDTNSPIHETLPVDQADQFLKDLSHEIKTDSDLILPNFQKKKEKTKSIHSSHPKDRKQRKEKTVKSRESYEFASNSSGPSNLSTSKSTTLTKSSSAGFRNEEGKVIFTIDLREDTFNLLHGRPDKGKVPQYKRALAEVLGLDPHLRITFASAYKGDGLQLSLGGRSKGISISDPAILHMLNDKNLKRISFTKPSLLKHEDIATKSFIPLTEAKQPSSFCKTPEEKKNDPLGIGVLQEVGLDEDDLMEYQPPEEDGGESFLDRLNQRKIDLEKKTRESPGDVERWLALVSLQDEMKELGLVGLRARVAEADQEAIRRHVQGTSDLKISYLKKALREPSNENNEKLLLAYMKAYCDQPDVDVSKEWRAILEAHPGVTGLWIAYVDWKQTEAGSMNVLEMVEVYEELIDRLVTRAENPSAHEEARNLYEQSIIYLFHRCCVMLKQAGYIERAIAAFQAIMELNFFNLRGSAQSLNELIEDFEAFWDSETPRVGEEGANGWANMKSECELIQSSPVTRQTDDKVLPEEIYSQWQSQEMKTQLPLRTSDSGNEDDPFGCVLFDDLRNLLFLVSSDDSRQTLLYSFLSFIGVPIPPPDIDTNVPFFTDPFLSTQLIDVPERQHSFWPKLESKISIDFYGPSERLPGIKEPQMIPFRIFPSDLRQLFSETSRWFVSFDPPADSKDLIRNSFQTLRTSPYLKHDVYFSLCGLSFEARTDVSTAVKLAKQLLSTDQNNLLLWDAYARLCLLEGKPKKARDVYVKALETIQERTEGIMSLWYSWAEMEYELGHFRLVTSILARAMKCLDETPSELVQNVSQTRSPALLLRVRRAFIGQITGSFQHDAPLSIVRYRVSSAVAFANFQHITEGFPSGCQTHESSLRALENLNSTVEEEELWISYCRLIYQQIKQHQSFKPLEIRKTLQRAITRFPNNSIFLSLFAFNESKMKIDNETRRLINSILLKEPSLTTANSWLFAIWVELNINPCTFNQAAVRSLFERALTNTRIRSCLQIWSLYIEFEVRNHEFSRARSLITRSHASCPWAKVLYLLPFSTKLRSVYRQPGELRRMLKLMDEKCIRIRDRSIHELIQTLDQENQRKLILQDSEDLLDSLEQNEFHERMKLMPY